MTIREHDFVLYICFCTQFWIYFQLGILDKPLEYVC